MKKTIIISGITLFLTLFFVNNSFSQQLESEFLYKITLLLDKPIDTGKSPFGIRIAYPIKGGIFEGPKMKGKVKPVGEDWLLKVDDVTNKLAVRLVLETEDGQLIACNYTGIVHNQPNEAAYWRITPTFETSSKQFDWLNYVLAVGKGSFQDGSVNYEVFAIK
ncbi:DUF3237 domain-containing protein [Emticicia aquatilis]|nr:DUF3237 domain-containing protein [Emticicia aquatilis]